MADSNPRRMLSNEKFLAENICGIADSKMTENVVESKEGKDQIPKPECDSGFNGSPNIIHTALDHSYVYNGNSVKYVNASCETDDSRDAESSEGIGEAIPGMDIKGEIRSSDYLQSFVSDEALLHLKSQEMPFSPDDPASSEAPEDGILTEDMAMSRESKVDVIRLKRGTKSSAPLGSVENPIQIVQQGNAYRSSQVLTKEHLQQIAQVLQQQQLGKALQNGGKSVLYDQATNTRIVYRVIYPSELQNKLKSEDEMAYAASESGTGKGKGRPKKAFMRRIGDDEKGRIAMSKEEREEKKKHRPRTRSGRISKPPSYMVKDYKRIHHLDFNEEPYDDSDGGYSDYHVSDEDKEKHPKQGALQDSTTAKKRNYRCVTCSKAYIGKGGLSRHYRLNPSHGSLAEGEDVSTQDENSNSSLASSVFSMPGTSSQSSVNISITKSDIESSLRQPSFVLQDFLSMKRKSKLKEILKAYPDEDLVEVLLPRVLPSISIWDFIAAKSRKGNSHQVDIPSLFANFEALLSQMKRIAKNCLSSSIMANDSSKSVVHVTNDEVASALNINTGTYFIRDAAKSYPIDLHHSYSSKRMNLEGGMNQRPKSVIPEEIPTSSKLRKLQALEASVIEEPIDSTLPDQILSDAQEVDCLELGLSVGFDGTADPVHMLNSIPENSDNQEFSSRAFLDCNNGMIASGRLLHTGGNSTTVTPSSLSSGCLSAVDASEAPRTHSFLTTTAVQSMDNVQLNEVSLFSSSLQNFHTDMPVNPMQAFSPTVGVKLNNINASDQIITASNDRTLLAYDDSNKLTSQSLVPSQESTADIYCPNIQQTSSVDFGSQATVSLLQADMSVVPGCLVNSANVDGLCTSNTSVDRVMSMGSITALDESNPPSYESVSKCNDLNSVSFNVQTTKPADSGAIIHQLILPGGQVVSTWPPVESQPEVAYTEQLLQESLAPDNLVLIQNPDGSYQMPSDQMVPLETLQALLNASQTVIKAQESSSHLL